MSFAAQVRIILVAGVLCLVGALYHTSMLIHWSLRSLEAKGTVVTIDGNSADHKPGARRACTQTLHYNFAGPDGGAHHGSESVWWGDCRLRNGSPVAVYYERGDITQNITRTGYDGHRHWAILLGVVSMLQMLLGLFLRSVGSAHA